MDESDQPEHAAGMVLIDNYWVDEADAPRYLAERARAAELATCAMSTFCASVTRRWAGSEDGEAVVGLDAEGSIRSVVHLDPGDVALILSLSPDRLIDYLR